jgi:hypothetical protein
MVWYTNVTLEFAVSRSLYKPRADGLSAGPAPAGSVIAVDGGTGPLGKTAAAPGGSMVKRAGVCRE